jgi:hypothetical protein
MLLTCPLLLLRSFAVALNSMGNRRLTTSERVQNNPTTVETGEKWLNRLEIKRKMVHILSGSPEGARYTVSRIEFS